MSVRKESGKARAAEPKEAWVVDYVDQHGDRHLKTFAKKRDADAHHAIVGVAVRAGRIPPTARASPSPEAADYGSRAAKPPGWNGPRGRLPAACRLHIIPILGR